MIEVLISSSVLIAAVALLRALFMGKIGLRIQYALWLLVALRLLIPVSLIASPVSVMNTVPSAHSALAAPPVPPSITQAGLFTPPAAVQPSQAAGLVTPSATPHLLPHSNLLQMARTVWLVGIVGLAVWLVGANLLFRQRLRRSSRRVEGLDCPLPVFMTAAVPSPCLSGLLRPAVYLPPDCLENEVKLRHILAHEVTHYRHGDPLWSLVRCVCLVLYWFHPLVWLAAFLSRQDCELACDEGAIRMLGEQERLPYGHTLLSMAVTRRTPASLLHTATSMTSDRSGLKKRIWLIAQKPRRTAVTLAAVVLITGIAAGCTFTGAQEVRKTALPLAAAPALLGTEFPAVSQTLEEALTVLPDHLKASVVLTEKENLPEGTLLEAFYAPTYSTGQDSRLFSLMRVTPVVFEKGFALDLPGGAVPLGRDAYWYYLCYSPNGVLVHPDHQEGYNAAYQAALAWVTTEFSRQDDITPIQDDPVYQTANAYVSYPGAHIDVSYLPYYGLPHAAKEADTVYRWVLSQPVKQGAGGIWCVDRWYDRGDKRLPYQPNPAAEVTLAAYYADLQAKADTGEASWRLDPLQVSMNFVEECYEQENRPAEAFTLGEVYGEAQT